MSSFTTNKSSIEKIVIIGKLYSSLLITLISDLMMKCFYKPIALKYDVLIIKVDNIGDYIVWLDSLRAYKEHLEGKSVALICNDLVKDIAMLDNFFDVILPYNKRKFFDVNYRISFTKQIRKLKFNEVIYPSHSRSYVGDNLVFLCRASVKVAYKGDHLNLTLWQKAVTDRFYTKLIENPEHNCSEFQYNENFVKRLFNYDFKAALPIFPVNIIKKNNSISENYCVFFLSSSNEYRSWKVENFVSVSEYIPNSLKVVLLGNGEKDMELGRKFIFLSHNKKNIINLINKTKIVETCTLISDAKFLIGNDSAGVHLAASLRIPSICIAPGANYGLFVPYPKSLGNIQYHPHVVSHKMECFGCGYRCIKPILGQYECVYKIKVADVIDILNDFVTL